MPDPQYTRCPACKTVFRVTAEQLAMREGRVRCGHCKTVFDGRAQLLHIAASAQLQDEEGDDEAVRGPPTMTLRTPHASPPAPPPPPRIAPAAPSPLRSEAPQFPWASEEKRSSRRATIAYAAGIPLLVLLLATQAAVHFRDFIAAWQPATKTALVRMCQPFGCTVQPMRDIANLSIDGSDLQADPAHRGLLVLSATIRNRSRWPLAYPDLELTLTDARDAVVARRALAPGEYAGGTADLGFGIAPNTEIPVKLFIDASATSQAGYRLYLFYP